MQTITLFAEHEAAIIYADWINTLETTFWKNGFINTRIEMVNWCIAKYGYVNSLLIRLIDRLYADGFIKA